MDGHTVEWDEGETAVPKETLLLADPRPRGRYVLDWDVSPPMRVVGPKMQFYALERLTSASGLVHYFYRYTGITNDEAITLLLYRYGQQGGEK